MLSFSYKFFINSSLIFLGVFDILFPIELPLSIFIKIKIGPEYFLILLKNAQVIVGNSSAGIREAPYYGVPTVDIGTRQLNRATLNSIFNCTYSTNDISNTINKALAFNQFSNHEDKHHFGEGKSDVIFFELLNSGKIWEIEHQKQFRELINYE